MRHTACTPATEPFQTIRTRPLVFRPALLFNSYQSPVLATVGDTFEASEQGWSLLLIGPFLDYYVVDSWVGDYKFSSPATATLLFSCALAVLVNLSQFACLGRFSAVSFQV